VNNMRLFPTSSATCGPQTCGCKGRSYRRTAFLMCSENVKSKFYSCAALNYPGARHHICYQL
jgi:hypothetical protein